jgi:hypothetical protein
MRRDLGKVEVLVDPVDQAVRVNLEHDPDSHGDQLAGMSGGVQDVLLDESADGSAEQPTIENP